MARKPLPPRRGLPPDPDANWNKDTGGTVCDPAEALEQAERIQEKIENDVPEWAQNKASDFFEDVMEKAKSVAKTIESTKRVTEGQKRALDGWEAGVDKWIK